MTNYIVANWKSNKSREQVEKWMDIFEKKLLTSDLPSSLEIVIAPPMPSMMFVSNRLLKRDLHGQTALAVQDISPYPAGSYTGAVSTQNLQGFRVRYAIVGHSERREYFGENHQGVAKKVAQCLEADITPILCVDDEYIADQAAAIEQSLLKKCVVAYEDLQSIGTGDSQPISHVTEVVQRIKTVFGDVPVLYGGSVDGSNAADYLNVCNGVLVGGASLDADEFWSVIRSLD